MRIGRATRGGIDTKENERKAACYGFSGFWRFWGPRGRGLLHKANTTEETFRVRRRKEIKKREKRFTA